MLSFGQFLLESRLDFLKNQNPTIDSSHDDFAKHRDPGAIIDHLSTGDPTSNKQYTSWILNQYKKKHIRQEDVGRVHETLSNFITHKSKLAEKDIGAYEHIADLDTVLEKHLGTAGSNRSKERLIKHEGAALIHDGPNLTVHRLKTKEAARLYGAGTKWCTAAAKNNEFNQYNKQGPLYVIQNKHTGEKHQLHFESNQFNDALDREVDLYDFVKEHPELRDVKEFRKSPYNFNFGKTPEETSKLLSKALEHPSTDVRHSAIEHPDIEAHHIDKTLDEIEEHDSNIRAAAASHFNAEHKHIDKALNDKDAQVREAAILNPNAEPHHIDKALNDKDPYVRAAAIMHHKAEVRHIDKALGDEDPYVRGTAIKHSKAEVRHIDKALDDENFYVRHRAIYHPKAEPKHFEKALND